MSDSIIDNYFTNTSTAKIIKNLDRHAIDRKEDLDRENINYTPINNKVSIIGNLVRFEEVSPANQDAAFLAVSIESLVAPLGLPIYEGYDDLLWHSLLLQSLSICVFISILAYPIFIFIQA
jgi:hypothetical protein